MDIDLPLRTLTMACPGDLLPLLGTPDAEVLGVDALEMPARGTRLDTLLRLRGRDGRIYRRLVEWQGYREAAFLSRVLGYLSWLGQANPEEPVAVTPIYLYPDADVGDTIVVEVDGQIDWQVRFRCVRLWQEDAMAAVRSGRAGLAALSPLMRGATSALVEEAAQVVLSSVSDRQRQADALSALGVLAAPLMAPERFLTMIGRERLMASELMEILMRERTADLEAAHARRMAALDERIAAVDERIAAVDEERERERAAMTETLAQALAEAVEEAIATRFPTAPLTIAAALHRVQDPRTLRDLLRTALRSPDLDTVQRAVEAAASA